MPNGYSASYSILRRGAMAVTMTGYSRSGGPLLRRNEVLYSLADMIPFAGRISRYNPESPFQVFNFSHHTLPKLGRDAAGCCSAIIPLNIDKVYRRWR